MNDRIQSLKRQLLENKRKYNLLFEKRIAGTIEERDFVAKEKYLERAGVALREKLGMSAKGTGSAYCHQCGKFFKFPNDQREGFPSCGQHRGQTECHTMQEVLNERATW